jgi:hypothetical protein
VCLFIIATLIPAESLIACQRQDVVISDSGGVVCFGLLVNYQEKGKQDKVPKSKYIRTQNIVLIILFYYTTAG